MSLFKNFDDDYHVEEASDDEDVVSSEEEVDDEEAFLSQFLDTEVAIRPKPQDFESEMNSELDTAILDHEAKYNFASTSENPVGKSKAKVPPGGETKEEFYDDAYFDSDDEDDEDKKDEKKKKRQVLSNDELFYDPDMDDEDQKWVDDSRRAYLPKTEAGRKQPPLPKSDATLTCPACMTVLCLDCQRHDVYANQFRAMFVRNCTVNFAERLHYPEKTKKSKKQNQSSEPGPSGNAKPSELYHPVACSICRTEVAVYYSDEIYHFLNVLASV